MASVDDSVQEPSRTSEAGEGSTRLRCGGNAPQPTNQFYRRDVWVALAVIPTEWLSAV